jgi:hypothetical protein
MKKPIVQKDAMGCGLACVAFVVGKSYKQIVGIAGREKAKNRGFYCRELAAILNQFGHSYQYRYLKPLLKKIIYRDDVIVFIKRSKKYPFGHYLVCYQNLWMDPWINFPKEKDVKEAEAGFRKRLPGKAIYALTPK